MLKMSNKRMIEKKDFIKYASQDGIGVCLKNYPPSRMADELSEMLNSCKSFSVTKKGNRIELSQDNSFLANLTVAEKGISFSAQRSGYMDSAIKIIVKFLVDKTFN